MVSGMRKAVVPARAVTARTALGLTQQEVAGRIGVKQQSIDKVERGETKNPKFLVDLAEVLQVTPGWLRGEAEDGLDAEERHLIAMYERLKPHDRQLLMDMARRLSSGQGPAQD